MKKRNILLAGAALSAAFAYGYVSHAREWFPSGLWTKISARLSREPGAGVNGWWARARARPGAASQDENDLTQIGYLAGVKTARGAGSVTVHDAKRAFAGLNVFTSGHGPEAVLMDMDGRILHRWRCEFDKAWPGREIEESSRTGQYWRRGHLYPNGDFVAVFDDLGVVRVDKDSKLLWAAALPVHHDLCVQEDGRIFVLTHGPEKDPRVRGGKTIWNDRIVVLDENGRKVDSLSMVDAFADSPYAPVLDQVPDMFDVFHTNSIEVFDGRLAERSPLFRKGNALVSLRSIDLVAIVDMDARRVVWKLSSMWRGQHDPTLQDDGSILVFDNLFLEDRSRLVEVDPLSQEVTWQYDGTKENGFFSELCGALHRLPNGNVLVTETDTGRVFELTRDREIVWEFENPFRAGEKNELIACIFDMERLPPDFPVDWLERH